MTNEIFFYPEPIPSNKIFFFPDPIDRKERFVKEIYLNEHEYIFMKTKEKNYQVPLSHDHHPQDRVAPYIAGAREHERDKAFRELVTAMREVTKDVIRVLKDFSELNQQEIKRLETIRSRLQ
jgi:hypothetical protein